MVAKTREIFKVSLISFKCSFCINLTLYSKLRKSSPKVHFNSSNTYFPFLLKHLPKMIFVQRIYCFYYSFEISLTILWYWIPETKPAKAFRIKDSFQITFSWLFKHNPVEKNILGTFLIWDNVITVWITYLIQHFHHLAWHSSWCTSYCIQSLVIEKQTLWSLSLWRKLFCSHTFNWSTLAGWKTLLNIKWHYFFSCR